MNKDRLQQYEDGVSPAEGGPSIEEIFGPVISSYSRQQAIDDGVLVDISEMAKEAGFKYPMAVTSGVFHVLCPWDTGVEGVINRPPEWAGTGQDFKGRAWDMFTIMRLAIRQSKGGDEIHFAPLFIMDPKKVKPVPVKMWSKCGPGDTPEPVLTIMLEGED